MFENLKALVKQENDENKKRALQRIAESEEACRRYATECRYQQYLDNKITKEELIMHTAKRIEREYNKDLQKKLAKLDTAEAAPDVERIAIHVHWKRSATWGYNPHAEVIINQKNRYTGKASGCGYDKQTAAIAEALDQNASVQRMLYQAKEKALQAGYDPESAKTRGPENNRYCIAYGAGYGALPYLEGGVGMSSFCNVFEACGLNVTERNESGKHYNFYYIEREAE